MDNIDAMMKEADRLGFGVSYGKYRAAYPNGSGDVIPQKTVVPPRKPTVTCRHCGASFEPNHGSQKYCSAECKETAATIRRNEYYRKNPKRKGKPKKPVRTVACIVCGMVFKTTDHRRKTCGGECAADRRRELTRQWRADHRKGD